MAAIFRSNILSILSVATNYTNIVSNAIDNVSELGEIKDVQQSLGEVTIGVTSDQEERYMNSSQLIARYGYRAEEHVVTSGSGYLLSAARVRGAGAPVLLVHGFTLSSDSFLVFGTKSLPFLLADAGYDVWLVNCRGNTYSKRHVYLSPEDPAFWKFSFHEIGTEDIPATVDYILKETDREKLAYVGHSQGCAAAYIMLSLNVTYNDKLSVMISMAPAAYLGHMFSPVLRAIAANENAVQIVFHILGINQVLPGDSIIKFIARDIFGSSLITAIILDVILFLLWGINFSQIDVEHVQNQISHNPDGASKYQLFHFSQNINTDDFKEYDFGEAKNIERYGSPRPPSYPLENITSKMYVFYSSNDWFVSSIDIQRLKSRLRNLIGEHEVAGFNHLDFCWARDANNLLYSRIIEVIRSTE